MLALNAYFVGYPGKLAGQTFFATDDSVVGDPGQALKSGW
jgi:hypothetical protein